jgi:hypothetical protein
MAINNGNPIAKVKSKRWQTSSDSCESFEIRSMLSMQKSVEKTKASGNRRNALINASLSTGIEKELTFMTTR